jgi:hypothetical protein
MHGPNIPPTLHFTLAETGAVQWTMMPDCTLLKIFCWYVVYPPLYGRISMSPWED